MYLPETLIRIGDSIKSRFSSVKFKKLSFQQQRQLEMYGLIQGKKR